MFKQYLSPDQWNELSLEQKEKFWGKGNHIQELPSIGAMIEFLGDYLNDITNLPGICIIDTMDRKSKVTKSFKNKGLIDTLWEACKYKLGV